MVLFLLPVGLLVVGGAVGIVRPALFLRWLPLDRMLPQPWSRILHPRLVGTLWVAAATTAILLVWTGD